MVEAPLEVEAKMLQNSCATIKLQVVCSKESWFSAELRAMMWIPDGSEGVLIGCWVSLLNQRKTSNSSSPQGLVILKSSAGSPSVLVEVP